MKKKEGFYIIFKNQFKNFIYNPKLIFLTLGVPIIIFAFYYSLFINGLPSKLPIVLVDKDYSEESLNLTRLFESNRIFNIIQDTPNQNEAYQKIIKRDAYAMIVIPKGFQKKIEKLEKTKIVCYYNGQYILPSSLINKEFKLLCEGYFKKKHIDNLLKSGLSKPEAESMVSSVDLDAHILYNPYTNYSFFLSISLMPMAFQVIIIITTIYVLGFPIKKGVSRRLYLQSRGNVWVAFWANILPYTIIFSIVGFFMNSLLFYKIGIPLKGSFSIINVFFILFIIVCQFVGVIFISITSTFRDALSIGGGFAALSFSFIGQTFPEEGMPIAIRTFRLFFPYASYFKVFTDYAIKGIYVTQDGFKSLLILLSFCIVGIILLPKYNRLLKRGRYYAK